MENTLPEWNICIALKIFGGGATVLTHTVLLCWRDEVISMEEEIRPRSSCRSLSRPRVQTALSWTWRETLPSFRRQLDRGVSCPCTDEKSSCALYNHWLILIYKEDECLWSVEPTDLIAEELRAGEFLGCKTHMTLFSALVWLRVTACKRQPY